MTTRQQSHNGGRRAVCRSITTCLAVVATIAGSMATAAGPAQAKTAGANGRIVFSRYDPVQDRSSTYTANPDGSDQRQLLPSYDSSSPHWSPDGTQVAVTSGLGAPCPPTCTGNTVVINPVTGRQRVLAAPDFSAVSTFCTIWSPDGNHFLCDGENDNDPSVNGVYTIRSSDGGGLTRITSAAGGGDDLPIDYSPDGGEIVFGHTGPFHTCDKTSALFVVNIDGTDLRRITPWGFCDDDGSWSPDGNTIAFARDDGFIFSVHPDGSGLQQVPLSSVPGASNGRTYAGDVAWSPDGSKIVLLLGVRTGSGSFTEGIATANRDGTHVQWATTSPTFDNQPDWGAQPQ